MQAAVAARQRRGVRATPLRFVVLLQKVKRHKAQLAVAVLRLDKPCSAAAAAAEKGKKGKRKKERRKKKIMG
jgi:hypothetical protein